MMRIVYFSQKAQLWAELEKVPGEKIFVTPSPAKADSLRSSVTGNVLTIAKFTSDLISTLWKDEEKPTIKRKAELLLIFGILKNKYFPTLGYEQFLQAYNLFSDLRSFTLNEDALSSVLEEQPEEIRVTVQTFWQLLNLTGYSDEHGAYHIIAEALRGASEEEALKKVFVFWGFQHLNGQQLDLLKALAIRYTVIIPFPLVLKEKLKRSDWVSWLSHDRAESQDLDLVEIKPRGEWLKINSREISYRLRTMIEKKPQIILGVPKLKPEHMDIIPSSQVGFKIQSELLGKEILEIADEVEHFEQKTLTELEYNLSLMRKESLKVVKEKFPYKKLKVLQLYQEAILSIRELTDDNITVDAFFLKLLRDVVLLNQPRTSFSPILSDSDILELKDMSSLEDIDRKRPVILCVDDRFDDLQGLGQNYTESVQKHLAALGPLKRNDLDLAFRQWEFADLFSEAQVTVLMSEGVLKHNLIWKKLFQGIELNVVNADDNRTERGLKDSLANLPPKKYEGSFSASRLQTYADCPRKFYYSFVEPLAPTLKLEKDIDQMVSGTLIHKIIEEFYHQNLMEEDVPALTREIFESYIRDNNLDLPHDVYDQRRLIFTHRSLNGIKFLKELETILGEKVEWKIEERFQKDESLPLNGIMDCLAITKNNIILLDFKSSKAAASTNTEVEAIESYQLWVYALAARKMIPGFAQKNIVMGFVVLDDTTESNLLLSDEDLFAKVKEAKIARPKMFSEPFPATLDLSWTKIQEIMTAVKTDKTFPPRPRKSNTCDFCSLISVCPRAEVLNGQG
jgi:RecB family exonuclease